MKKIVILFIVMCQVSLWAQVNRNNYITFTVTQGATIGFRIWGGEDSVDVRIESGSYSSAGKCPPSSANYGKWLACTAGSTTMTVYGNVTKIWCRDYTTKVTAVNASGNSVLKTLSCENNAISSITVNSGIESLNCRKNQLTGLNLANKTALVYLNCGNNKLTSLTLTNNTVLGRLYCDSNNLSSLSLSTNRALEYVECSNNKLSSLDVSNCLDLTLLLCYGNSFTTQGYNNLMCSLPPYKSNDNRNFYPLYNSSDANNATFGAANAEIGKTKKWNVRYRENLSNITTTGTYDACILNDSRYINLTCQQGVSLNLYMATAAAGTPVKITNGTLDTTFAVGPSWQLYKFTTKATNVTVYGSITKFDCGENESKLTAIDVSHNPILTELDCSDNRITRLDVSQNKSLVKLACFRTSLTTQAYDDLMCSLPPQNSNADAKFSPLYNAQDANYSKIMATNTQMAKFKNWKVIYEYNRTDIPATTGRGGCAANMNRYITLQVKQGQTIKLDILGDTAFTPVKIVSGTYDTTILTKSSWTGFISYKAQAETMTVYGNVLNFDCKGNGENITGINPGHNTALERLYCFDNSITSLDLSLNSKLTLVACQGNPFTTMGYNVTMCLLPAKSASANAVFAVLTSATDTNYSKFLASYSQTAKEKNWNVIYMNGYSPGTSVPNTTGKYDCTLDMYRYICLTVRQGASISFKVKAKTANTNIMIINGSDSTRKSIGTSWSSQTLTAKSNQVWILGTVQQLDCSNNGEDLTAIDLSWAHSLDYIACYNNGLNTEKYNDLYCALPWRSSEDNAVIYPQYNASSSNKDIVEVSAGHIPQEKGWRFVYYTNSSTTISTFISTYTCPVGIAELKPQSTVLNVYPNPAHTHILIENMTDDSWVKIYDYTGRLVKKEQYNKQIDITDLTRGLYIIVVGNLRAKFVKE